MLLLTFKQKIAAILLLGSLILGGALWCVTDPLRQVTEYREELPSGTLYIHLCGAVARPGVLAVASGSRVFEAVAKAGGALAEADLAQINLAAFVEDGEQIYLPKKGEVLPHPGYYKKAAPRNAQTGAARRAAKDGQGNRLTKAAVKPKIKVSWPLDLNQATREQLELVPGIGPVMAEKILAYRQAQGDFPTYEALTKVSGIGESKLEKFRPYLCVK